MANAKSVATQHLLARALVFHVYFREVEGQYGHIHVYAYKPLYHELSVI